MSRPSSPFGDKDRLSVVSLPDDTVLIETEFREGPLGVTLRRRQDTGIVYVHEIVPGSQAVQLDVAVNDELWSVGSSHIGTTPLDKEAWTALIQFIKACPRPLIMTWRRKPLHDENPTVAINLDLKQLIITESSNSLETMSTTNTPVVATGMNDSQFSIKSTTPVNSSSSPIPDPSPTVTVEKLCEITNIREIPDTDELNVDGADEENVSEHSSFYMNPSNMSNVNMNQNLLQELAGKLYIKEKEKSISAFSAFIGRKSNQSNPLQNLTPYPLLAGEKCDNNNKRLIRVGDALIVSSKSSHVSVNTPTITSQSDYPTNKVFILLNDVLLIAMATLHTDILIVEETIPLSVCKIKKYLVDCHNPLPIPLQASDLGGHVDTDRIFAFDLTWSGGSVQVGFFNDDDRDDWLNSLSDAIFKVAIQYDAHEVFGWKHYYLLGSVHSAVINQDLSLLQEILSYCDHGVLSYSIIDAKDEAGFTPIHYACIFKLHSIIQLLYNASAGIDIPDNNGLTPLHWSCMILDYDAIVILTTNCVMDIDMRDYDDRTALFLTLVEGRYDNITSTHSAAAVNAVNDDKKQMITDIKLCAERLLSLHAETNVADHHGQYLIHYMAASWFHEIVQLLLQHQTDIMTQDYENGMTPLHYASRGISKRLLYNPLYNRTAPGNTASGATAAVVAASEAVEINDISNGVPTLKILLQAGARPNFKDRNGKTPLHCVIESGQTVWGENLSYAIITLLSYGARLDDPSLSQAIKSKFLHLIDFDQIMEARLNSPVLDADSVGIVSFDNAKETAMVMSTEKPVPLCNLCEINFTIFRRQHHCRLCDALCCDDCSKRRAILSSSPVRTCDACYNRLQTVIERSSRLTAIRFSALSSSSPSPSPTPSFAASSSTSTQSNRDKLFSGAQSSSATAATSQSATAASQGNMAATMSTLNEVSQRLHERGEKLSKLSDRTADLANNANEFARLAKQLKEKQKSSWF